MNKPKKFKELLKLKGETGKKDSLITFLVHGITIQKWIDDLYHQLDKCKGIKNGFKRKEVNNRLFSLITYLKENYTETNVEISAVCLLYEELHFFLIPKKKKLILEECNIKNILYFRDDYFRIDVLEDIFFNENWKHSIYLASKNIKYSIFTKHKTKVIFDKKFTNDKDLEIDINNIDLKNEQGIIYGKNRLLKTFECDKWFIINENFTKDELLDKFIELELAQNNELLDKIFEMIEKGDNKLIIGKKEMSQNINNYMVKEV